LQGDHDTGFLGRCLLRAARAGTLATQTPDGPFASLVTPAVAPGGGVLLLLSSLAAHTRHLLADPRCALMVVGEASEAEKNPQTAPRLTVTGHAARDHDPESRRLWLSRHPYAALYADFSDFALWRITPQAGHFVGGFARAAKLEAGDLRPPDAAVAALAAAEADILAHCNADHADALALLGGDTLEWRMLGLTPDGFFLGCGDRVTFCAFAAPVADAAGARDAVGKVVKAATLRASVETP
jgi:putative heme iron utilization protein